MYQSPFSVQQVTYWYSWAVLRTRSRLPDTAWWWYQWAGSRPCRSRWQSEKMLFHPNDILCHYWECQGYRIGQLWEKWENEEETVLCISMSFSSIAVLVRTCLELGHCEGGGLDRLKWSENIFLRLQKGCVPDQVPLGKHILSEEPIRS